MAEVIKIIPFIDRKNMKYTVAEGGLVRKYYHTAENVMGIFPSRV